jgi:DnaA family protein
MRQLLLHFIQAPAPSFDNFVPGRNAEPLAALRAALAGAGPRVIYLWGEPGAGKTHLLRAYAGAVNAVCLAAPDYAGNEAGAVLVLDDIERLSEERQVTLFNAFNAGMLERLVVAAHAAPRDVPLRRDLATRLATGLTYRLLALSDEEKRAALEAHAKARGFDLREEVALYLLTHARRDMGSLIRSLDALDRFSLETGRPITVPLLKAALQPELGAGPAP